MVKFFCDFCGKEILEFTSAELNRHIARCPECKEKRMSSIPLPVSRNCHTEHCCLDCGCAYGEDDCPVVTGKVRQSFKCGEACTCGGW